jgi:xanthine dehydrogenase accessory factor
VQHPYAIDEFLAHGPAALVRVEAARGSTPREAGAWMLASRDATLGTIGGGQLEYMAIDAARAMLARGSERDTLDVPLGPEIGQCCGGRVTLAVSRVDTATAARLRAGAAPLPAAFVFGAGHVGRALAAALTLLPLRTLLVDQRQDELAHAPAGVDTLLTPLPEGVVRDAPPGSAFSVLTHDHALDFLILREALARGDAAHVGMIGSRTKRASFERWARRHGGALDTGRLVCPIGAAGRPDKRPEVIAVFAAAEIMAAVNAHALQSAGRAS